MNRPPAETGPREPQDDLQPEYQFDYSKAKPNRFAAALGTDSVAVVLEPDVAAVFHDGAQVNAILRSIIAALPKPALTGQS